MNLIKLGTSNLDVSSVAVGCMRLAGKTPEEMNSFVHSAMDMGINFFDHADIYGGGRSEEVFGQALCDDTSIKRENMIIQSKCGIRKVPGGTGYYDQSKEYIIASVDGILKRLKTDYLDVLLLHRPDALVEPEEVAAAFDELEKSGKVRNFGVSNHKPSQIALLKKYVKQPIHVNQMQFSIPVSNMIANGMEVNMTSDGAIDRDGSVLDYCRLNDITIQAWSPFQMANWRGCFIDSEEFPELNQVMSNLAEKYNTSKSTIAASWILRHPAKMQIIAGTANEAHLKEIADASEICLARDEWYQLYLSAGHPLP